MKKTLLFLISIAFTLSGNSQDYIPFLSGNSVWKSYGIDNSQPSTEVNVDVEYRLSEDTVISGMNYRILQIDQSSPSSSYPFIEEAYLRENVDEKKVFIRFREEDQVLFENNEEVLLYDFSLSEGEFFELYDEFDGNEVNIINDTTYTIDGVERRAWLTDFPAIIADLPHSLYVEGIGFLSDPLMPIFPDEFVFYRAYTYCYRNAEDEVTQEFDYPWVPEEFNCNATVSTQNADMEELSVYPNPTSSMFVVTGEKFASIKVKDILGQTLFELNNLRKQRVEISTSGLDDGLYLLEICNYSEECTIERLVVER